MELDFRSNALRKSLVGGLVVSWIAIYLVLKAVGATEF